MRDGIGARMRRQNGLLKRFRSCFVRFGRDEQAVTLIEFGILAVPFFTIMAAILETALVFLAGQILDSAVQDSSRWVRTGQAQAAEYDGDEFRAALCGRLYGMFDCTAGAGERLRIRVAVMDNFTAAAIGYPLSTGEDCDPDECEWTLVSQYEPGGGGEVVLVQAFYKWPTLVNLPGFNLGSLPDGSRLLGASRLFRNEPFGCTDCT